MNLLFFSEKFLDLSNANALCVRNLLDALSRQNVQIDIVCTYDEATAVPFQAQNIRVHTIPYVYTWYERLCSKNRVLRHLLKPLDRLTTRLLLCKSTLHEMYTAGKHLLSDQKYDAVIAVHQSEMAVRCVLRLKKYLKETKKFLYMLDPIAGVLHKRRIQAGKPGKILGFLSALFLKHQAFQNFDKLLFMFSNKGSEPYWERKFAAKICYTYLPLLTDKPILQRASTSKNDNYRLICYGILDSVFRSPVFLLDVLEEMNRSVHAEIDFYTKGDCEDMLKAYERKWPRRIHCHGYVDRDLLMQKIASSDAIVCISNQDSTMLPSKVFDILSLGVPTISLSSQTQDPTDELFQLCKHVQIIKTAEGSQAAAQRIHSFLGGVSEAPVENIRQLLWQYTPESNAAQLINWVNE